jgi:hypothetical protein
VTLLALLPTHQPVPETTSALDPGQPPAAGRSSWCPGSPPTMLRARVAAGLARALFNTAAPDEARAGPRRR